MLHLDNRSAALATVFLLSAVFHEYILIVGMGFFYPVLFVMFAGAGCKYAIFKILLCVSASD